MANLIIQGTVTHILPIVGGIGATGKEWKRQDFVISTHEQYSKSKSICIQGFNKLTEYVDNLAIGDNVEISFNIESREYQSRWYTQVTAWKIEKINAAIEPNHAHKENTQNVAKDSSNAAKTESSVLSEMVAAGANIDLEYSDDLPF